MEKKYIYKLFKLVIAYVTKVKGKNVLREICALRITKGYCPSRVKKNCFK